MDRINEFLIWFCSCFYFSIVGDANELNERDGGIERGSKRIRMQICNWWSAKIQRRPDERVTLLVTNASLELIEELFWDVENKLPAMAKKRQPWKLRQHSIESITIRYNRMLRVPKNFPRIPQESPKIPVDDSEEFPRIPETDNKSLENLRWFLGILKNPLSAFKQWFHLTISQYTFLFPTVCIIIAIDWKSFRKFAMTPICAVILSLFISYLLIFNQSDNEYLELALGLDRNGGK